jgi:putative FmdB family regulatory protein
MTYVYKCKKCNKELEIEQKITEKPIKICPYCNTNNLMRQITNGNFLLKGSGWYADGYDHKRESPRL